MQQKQKCRICIEPLLPDGTCRYASTHPPKKWRKTQSEGIKRPAPEAPLLRWDEANKGMRKVIPDYDKKFNSQFWNRNPLGKKKRRKKVATKK